MYTELFNRFLNVTCSVCEVSKDDLLSNSHQCEIVDVRSLLVYLLYKEGVYPSVIAKLMNKSSVGIRNLIRDHDKRKESNKLLETMSIEVRNKLKSN